MEKRKWMLRIGFGILNLALVGTAAAQESAERVPGPPPPVVTRPAPSYLGDMARPGVRGPAITARAIANQSAAAFRADDSQATSHAVATVVVTSHEGSPYDGDPPPRRLPEPDDDDGDGRLQHGLRLGYVATLNHDKPGDENDPESSPKRKLGLESPHSFLLGYEITKRIQGGGWLNILLIANTTIAGLEQSKLLPNANLLIGFELRESFQMGVGINLAPVEDKPAHMILAAGWTPRTGELLLPVHLFMIPDVDGHHRIGVTVGVNWEL